MNPLGSVALGVHFSAGETHVDIRVAIRQPLVAYYAGIRETKRVNSSQSLAIRL
jgi:hypothetical protein